MDIITVENVSKQFKKHCVLKKTTIAFEKGKIHGIIGRNGSGKTIFLKLISGLLCPTSGTITVNGKVLGNDADFAPNTGIIIETPGFLSYKSGYANLRELASIKGIIGKDEIIQAIQDVGLDPDDKKPVGKYSLGMRQRLGIAQAIMERPDLLILDEPMNSLDKQGVQHMRELLLQLREQGTTILLASHIAMDVELLCDTVCEIDEGVITKVKGWDF